VELESVPGCSNLRIRCPKGVGVRLSPLAPPSDLRTFCCRLAWLRVAMGFLAHTCSHLLRAGRSPDRRRRRLDRVAMPGTVETAMELYHRTDAAKAILAEGFRDATGSYMTTNE